MKRQRASVFRVLPILVSAALATASHAQTGDVFSFIPLGGRSILNQLAEKGVPPAELKAMLGAKHTSAEWLGYLKERAAAIPALKALGEKELLTLSDYLAANMPLPPGAIPAQPTKANLGKALPHDGRDMALDYCQSCHIITVVVTQDRTREAWLGTMNKPSHVQIGLTPAQRGALADYLVRNGGIPIDQVPEELRAGGASY
jgi:mono/diheme cytochrome c family protein